MEENRYKITTVQELLATYRKTPNKANFIVDLTSFLEVCSPLFDLVEKMGAEAVPQHYTWIDDEKHEATINLIPQEPNQRKD